VGRDCHPWDFNVITPRISVDPDTSGRGLDASEKTHIREEPLLPLPSDRFFWRTPKAFATSLRYVAVAITPASWRIRLLETPQVQTLEKVPEIKKPPGFAGGLS